MIKAVLFDLDGTLLPVDLNVFLEGYLGTLTKKATLLGYNSKQLIDTLWKGIAGMVRNDGTSTNETVFWKVFTSVYGKEHLKDRSFFDDYYRNEFQEVRHYCGYSPEARRTVDLVKSLGLRTVLATNALYPAVAIESRVRWAGLDPSDFEWYTTYENIGFCKPNPRYYAEIASKIGLLTEECLMVGNDVCEDMIVRTRIYLSILTAALRNCRIT